MSFGEIIVMSFGNGIFIQILAIAIAICLSMDLFEIRDGKSVAYLILRIVGLSFVMLFLGWLIDLISVNSPEIIRAPQRSFYYSLVRMAVISLYAVFLNKDDWRVRLLVCGSVFVSSVTLTELGGAAGLLLQRATSSDPVIMRIVCSALILVIAVLINKFHIRKFPELPKLGTVIGFAMIAAGMAIVLVGQMTDGLMFNYSEYAVVAYLFLYAIEIMIYFLIYISCSERAERIQMQLEINLAKANKNFVEVSDSMLSDIRQLRHDLKNQYAYMDALIDRGDYDGLKKYFTELSVSASSVFTSYIDCGNKCISAILNMKKSVATANGIGFETDILIPSELPFPDADMCSMLTNLLDNAIEAVVRLGIKDAVIKTDMKQNGDYLYITVKNPVNDSVDISSMEQLITSKSDGLIHGFGTRIVKRIADSYNGIATFKIENGMFEAKAMLDMFYKENAKISRGGGA